MVRVSAFPLRAFCQGAGLFAGVDAEFLVKVSNVGLRGAVGDDEAHHDESHGEIGLGRAGGKALDECPSCQAPQDCCDAGGRQHDGEHPNAVDVVAEAHLGQGEEDEELEPDIACVGEHGGGHAARVQPCQKQQASDHERQREAVEQGGGEALEEEERADEGDKRDNDDAERPEERRPIGEGEREIENEFVQRRQGYGQEGERPRCRTVVGFFLLVASGVPDFQKQRRQKGAKGEERQR